ncbi:FtsX-like permease family protein [Streptomyces sp. NPDC046805]|uniref:ABC transporter permease n=1 Tax=Streptomyces sp. NPDC046805 TaxID=3155134 RepID=UPI0033C3AD9A
MRVYGDLAMGVRFAFGGREGWLRTLLTAVGVGLGVALLLLTASIPTALAARHDREAARMDDPVGTQELRRADDTLVVARVDTTYRGTDVRGRLVEPEGARAPLPPGLTAYPARGDMVVSPALKELLASDGGRLLRERIPYRIAGTIRESGLVGSHELAYYAGAEGLAARLDGWRVTRIDAFGDRHPVAEQTDPVLALLVLVVVVVLLMPVAVFVAAAVRLGGERRDRRLAALRLVGSDSRMTRRIAAGEALAGALFGLVVGTGFFLVARRLAGFVEFFGVSVFPGCLNPSPAPAALIALAVPTAAVLVTLFALRGVVIEPLGVVRTARPVRRRLWWRLLLPLAGLALLAPMLGQGRGGGSFNEFLVSGGVVLLLVGVTALLPWVVEAVVARLGSGPLAWQLALRRLQLSSGTAARTVNGIAVAVAGAIALQMVFAGVQGDYTENSSYEPGRAQMQVDLPHGIRPAAAARRLAATEGVRRATALSYGSFGDRPWSRQPRRTAELTVGDCAALREAARLPSCRDGDVFVVTGADHGSGGAQSARPGTRLYLSASRPSGRSRSGHRSEVVWTVPADVRHALPARDPAGSLRGGFLMTPGALPARAAPALAGTVFLSLDESTADVHERVRTTAAAIDPLTNPTDWTAVERSRQFTSLRTGLFVGAACVLALVGASLLVSQVEQLRERRKLLSSLVALGTRRRTLGLSVLWQTAVPVALGVLLASAVGLTLGAVLLSMINTPVAVDWASVLSMAGIGAAVVLAVTLLSLPPLLRLARPEGLRTE